MHGVCGMDRSIIRQHLLQAERHVAQGALHLARQEALIAKLERGGHDLKAARTILATLRETQALHQQGRERLLQEARMATSAREDRTALDQPKIYRLANIRKEDAQRAAQLREM